MPGEKQLAAGMFEEGVLAGGELAQLFAAQIGHMVGIARIEAEAEIDKGLAVALVSYRGNG